MYVAFRDGAMAKECTWQTVDLISKGKEELQGIGLVEVLWKAATSLLNCWLMVAVSYQNAIYGFWVGRGTGTAALEAKMLQQPMPTREAVLFKIFLDIQEA